MKIFGIFTSAREDNQKRYPTDESLIEGLRNEEYAAIELLYAQVTKPICSLASSRGLTNESSIEDCIQIAVTKMIIRIRNNTYVYQGNKPSSFVIEIGKNEISNQIRKKRFEPEENIPEKFTFESTIDTVLLKETVNQLDATCRTLITKHYLQGWTYDTIVEEGFYAGAPKGIRMKATRCMEILRERLRVKGFFE